MSLFVPPDQERFVVVPVVVILKFGLVTQQEGGVFRARRIALRIVGAFLVFSQLAIFIYLMFLKFRMLFMELNQRFSCSTSLASR